jgi:hypothetical protein
MSDAAEKLSNQKKKKKKKKKKGKTGCFSHRVWGWI